MRAEKAREPFQFCTRFHLTETTGLRASTLEELLALLREVPGSCIYHHTHRTLQQHEYLSPEPPNDFAYWITDVLGEEELGEKVASIDIMQFGTIRSLRDRIVSTIEEYAAAAPAVKRKFAQQGKEFCFLRSVSFVAPTHQARDLGEFVEILGRITLDSVYFHIFEARLRLENISNDFSNWIETSIGDRELAESIARLDPYTYALDDLRKALITVITTRREGPHGED
ncbi:MAG: DUF5752 family protein [Endomicrobiales bacterium]